MSFSHETNVIQVIAAGVDGFRDPSRTDRVRIVTGPVVTESLDGMVWPVPTGI